MGEFQYRAVDPRGESVQGVVQAASEEAALSQLRAGGLVVYELDAADLRLSSAVRGRFVMQLSVLLDAGVGLVPALEVLAATFPVAAVLHRGVCRGKRLSEAMGRLFPPTWVGMVKLGEETGGLVLVLHRLAQSWERDERRRGRLLSSLAYPAFTLVGAGAVAGTMVFWLIPRFVGLIDSSQPLPFPTRVLMSLANPLVGLALAAAGALLAAWAYRQRGRLAVVRKYAVARMCRSVALLLDSGIPLAQGLKLLQETSPAGVGDRLQRLREGAEVRELFVGGDIPPMVAQLAAVGVETGRLAPMLSRAADMLEDEVEGRVETLITLLEPLLIGFCGLVVGFVVMAAFLPAYRLLLE